MYADAEGEARLRTAFAEVAVAVVEPGWEDRWRMFHRPVHAGGLWIGPPWEAPPPGEPAVVVDPGRAFGTGAHATTRLCIELLVEQERSAVLDAGCGSGVTAVAAARFGFAPVYAIDLDPVAVEVSRETAARNGVEIEVRQADVLRDELPPVELIVANIELRLVELLLARRPAARAITSGYLVHERPSAAGWAHVERVEDAGWAADSFASTSAAL